jgi:hypothetical protein
LLSSTAGDGEVGIGVGIDTGGTDGPTPGAVAREIVLDGATLFVSVEAATVVAVAIVLPASEEDGEALPFLQLKSYKGALFRS